VFWRSCSAVEETTCAPRNEKAADLLRYGRGYDCGEAAPFPKKEGDGTAPHMSVIQFGHANTRVLRGCRSEEERDTGKFLVSNASRQVGLSQTDHIRGTFINEKQSALNQDHHSSYRSSW
jgi:hypothetical protein